MKSVKLTSCFRCMPAVYVLGEIRPKKLTNNLRSVHNRSDGHGFDVSNITLRYFRTKSFITEWLKLLSRYLLVISVLVFFRKNKKNTMAMDLVTMNITRQMLLQLDKTVDQAVDRLQ